MTGGASPKSHQSNKLYVGNLDYKVTTEELASHFKSAQGFVSAEVVASNSGRSRGYGLVEFSSASAANKAIDNFNESTVGERKIFVRIDRGANEESGDRERKPAAPRNNERRPNNNNFNRSKIAPLKVRPEDEGRLLYVGNIPWRASWQDIKDHFREVGPVIRVDIPVDKETRRSRGFATVLFEHKDDAARAIQKLNNTELNGRSITVRFDQYAGGKKDE